MKERERKRERELSNLCVKQLNCNSHSSPTQTCRLESDPLPALRFYARSQRLQPLGHIVTSASSRSQRSYDHITTHSQSHCSIKRVHFSVQVSLIESRKLPLGKYILTHICALSPKNAPIDTRGFGADQDI